ncbi:MAG: DNA mismatch repair protein MutS [Chromatiales bacterium 21-64-14]|nr:MAG: DNA mismatch repair protein MutS [Chromatiales bacterium 21-64-14]HQU14790.1 DNA mismatch repair protein MutS [Gammaproteobacteria bacterium]
MRSDLKALDFDAIQRLLEQRTATPYGADAARALEPAPDLAVARRMQDAVSAARHTLDAGQAPVLAALPDIRAALRQAGARGAALNPNALQHILQVLQAAAALVPWVHQCPALYPGTSADLEPPGELVARLGRTVHESGRLRDDASPALVTLHTEQQELRREAESIVRARVARKDLAGLVPEPDRVVWQHDRALIKVRAEAAGSLKGVRRGSAAGGRDVLMEPLEAVGVNNRLEVLAGKVGAEQHRVLREVSGEVREQAEPLERLIAALTWVDLALAAGRLSADMNAHAPRLAAECMVDLRAAYHPLLMQQFADGSLESLVPLTLRLDPARSILMLTGPNTGGKTVALKTLGLLVTMAHCGLHIPAEGDCAIGAYQQVMVDVGDRQSVYHQLSTFAGHVAVLKRILEAADAHTLVLLDELGTGTDPEEGAALAMAVLDELAGRGVQGIVNTHLAALKDHAARHPPLCNACMLFDRATLRPTYHLKIGEPGVSLGLTIAEHGGLPPAVVQRAREYLKVLTGPPPPGGPDRVASRG